MGRFSIALRGLCCHVFQPTRFLLFDIIIQNLLVSFGYGVFHNWVHQDHIHHFPLFSVIYHRHRQPIHAYPMAQFSWSH